VTTGEKLKQMRLLLGLSQREVGEAIDLARSEISLYELGKFRVPIYSLIKLAAFFDTTTEHLLGREELQNGIRTHTSRS
jgi:transcriptional regulator with XRE-family HTH domain